MRKTKYGSKIYNFQPLFFKLLPLKRFSQSECLGSLEFTDKIIHLKTPSSSRTKFIKCFQNTFSAKRNALLYKLWK